MSTLLDVNTLLASRWRTHADHEDVHKWLGEQREFYTTPIVELGFMRVSLSPAYSASWQDAHLSLTRLISRPEHRFLSDNVSAADSPETNYRDSTDAHLVRLANQHNLKLATLDKALLSKSWAVEIAFHPLLSDG